MYYTTAVQPTPTGTWPNTYQSYTQPPAQTTPAVYYQMPTVMVPPFSTDISTDVIVPTQQPIPTVYYQTPAVPVLSAPFITNSQLNAQPQEQSQTTSITTIKTTKTKVLDSTTLPTTDNNGTIEETKTVTTLPKSEVPATEPFDVPTKSPSIEATTISETLRNRPHLLRTPSTSTYSDSTITSTNSVLTTPTEVTRQQQQPPPILPPPMPITTTNIAPVRRVIHHAHRPPRISSGYYSSDLDYERRKVYKTDYKYRHYYCCNWCKGRWDLRNRSYGCCEWFYGCPVWGLIVCSLFFLALLITFFTLFGLQPSINPTRYADTAQTRLLNRTQIVYGFYKNCGFQINATSGTPTTLILCTNTATTTTARIELSPFYTVISGTDRFSYSQIFVTMLSFILFLNVQM